MPYVEKKKMTLHGVIGLRSPEVLNARNYFLPKTQVLPGVSIAFAAMAGFRDTCYEKGTVRARAGLLWPSYVLPDGLLVKLSIPGYSLCVIFRRHICGGHFGAERTQIPGQPNYYIGSTRTVLGTNLDIYCI